MGGVQLNYSMYKNDDTIMVLYIAILVKMMVFVFVKMVGPIDRLYPDRQYVSSSQLN